MNRNLLALLSLLSFGTLLSGPAAAGGYAPVAPAATPAAQHAPVRAPIRAAAAISAPAATLVVPALPLGGTPTPAAHQANENMTVGSGNLLGGDLRSAADAATAELRNASGAVQGEVFLTQLAGGEMLVNVQAEGLTPGDHGMHVHTVGQCSDKVVDGKPTTFGAAEGHFDPAATHNHATPDTPTHQAHAGDLPMLTVGADGRGQTEFTTRKFSLRGENGILGRALIVHASADDYQTDPAGNSGARVLCGVIQGLEQH